MKGSTATERRVLVTQGSLTEGTETLLVNASNTNARLGSGVSGAIGAACDSRR
jgi:O-acetyl-ADP-ribose deacetylase (regulator of RNase III)